MRRTVIQTAVLTTFAMIAFASNSLLNRLALGRGTIDAISYTTIRLTAGALMLFIIATLQKQKEERSLRGSWLSAALLFLYAITFSFAYLTLSTGTGALILFSSVQITMLGVALTRGERPQLLEWVGLILALSGLVYLVFPGLTAPPPLGSALMLAAGIAWGFYSIRGRGSQNPLADTAGNFVYATPMILGIVLMIVGVILTITIVGAIVGIPLAIVGLLLFLKGIF